MTKLMAGTIAVLVLYSLATTYKLGVLEGQTRAFEIVSVQVDRGTLDLKGE